MASAQLHPEVIDEYLKELDMGRMLGPFPSAFTALEHHTNRFGVIPKGQSGSGATCLSNQRKV
jgi:hypothetical protein